MPRVVITIDTNNASFDDQPHITLGKILEDLSLDVAARDGGPIENIEGIAINDPGGNTSIGRVEVLTSSSFKRRNIPRTRPDRFNPKSRLNNTINIDKELARLNILEKLLVSK